LHPGQLSRVVEVPDPEVNFCDSVSPENVIESLRKNAAIVNESPVAARQSAQWQIACIAGSLLEVKLN
jgi:hypothetical protein